MLLEAIYHKSYSEYAHPIDENTLFLRLRTKKDDIITVNLYYQEKYDNTINGIEKMVKNCSDDMFDYFEIKLNVGIKRFNYMFKLEDKDEVKWYNSNGFFTEKPKWGYFTYSCICKGDIFEVPEWFENSIIYQIMPDRFSILDIEDTNHKLENKYNHYGGTLEGIIARIPHLTELGINVVYLTPFFKSRSYHGYDINDYYKIDESFGDSEKFKKLVKLCHDNKFKVILDAVFNHCGSEFFAVKDILINGENSKYKDWFIIKSFPVTYWPKPNYECFASFGGMPKLNTCNDDVMTYLCDVAMYWIKEYDIDGWRFDTADEVDRPFIRRLRSHIKSAKKDAVLIGEIWDEGSSWLSGDQFDSYMNYPLKALLNDLLAYKSKNAKQFRNKLNSYRMCYKKNVPNTIINIIGSHDTQRYLTLCGDDTRRFELGVVYQFTSPGVPMVYYGDEIGMTGEGDPDCRKPMIWDKNKWNIEIFELYKFLIKLRKDHSCLINGEYIELNNSLDDHILAFIRENENESILVLMNSEDKEENLSIKLGKLNKKYSLFFDMKTKKLQVIGDSRFEETLKPYEWKIYKLSC